MLIDDNDDTRSFGCHVMFSLPTTYGMTMTFHLYSVIRSACRRQRLGHWPPTYSRLHYADASYYADVGK